MFYKKEDLTAKFCPLINGKCKGEECIAFSTFGGYEKNVGQTATCSNCGGDVALENRDHVLSNPYCLNCGGGHDLIRKQLTRTVETVYYCKQYDTDGDRETRAVLDY